MKKILMTSLSVCSLGVSCNEMSDTPMLLVVPHGYFTGPGFGTFSLFPPSKIFLFFRFKIRSQILF